MFDNEFTLFDRLEVIKQTINKYGEENFYLAFSGGKDSTVVHHLLDMALPGNKIPRVFSNTGIEYLSIVKFVKELKENDERFEIVTPKQNIRATLERVGYPFKSKDHSNMVYEWQRGNRNTNSMKKYLSEEKTRYSCPKILRYQFSDEFNIKLSNKCCYEMKKKPSHDWQRLNKKPITITGMMREEGGARNHIDCIVTKKDKVVKFHPLSKVTSEWEEWFIKEYDIKLCELYYPPYNFKRSGCKGCPFVPDLGEQLSIIEKYMPHERRQCEIIWRPIYEEYRRIGYRLKNNEEIKLF